MKSFWRVYVAAVVAGSAVVWFAAPYARPSMSRLLKKDEPEVVGKSNPMLHGGKAASADNDKGSTSGHTAKGRGKVDQGKPASMDDPPALLGIFRVVGREKPKWGVVRIKTNFYDSEGKRLGKVPGGVILNFLEARKSSKGTMVLCKFQYKGKVYGPYLLKRTDISLFTGNYSDLSETQRKNFEEYYKIRGLMEERKVEVMQQIAIRNPHYTQYKAAYDKYINHIEDAKELTAKRDKAEGLRRSSLDDQLRLMKNQEAALKKTYDQIQAKYKTWKTANASELPDSNADPQVKEYRLEMRRIAKLIPGLAY